MIVIRRRHYSAPAFPKAVKFTRAGGRLCFRLQFKRKGPSGDDYELRIWNPKVKGKRSEAVCRLIEDRTGKWLLDVHPGARSLTTCNYPPSVQRHVDEFVAELDAAVQREDAQSAEASPPTKRSAGGEDRSGWETVGEHYDSLSPQQKRDHYELYRATGIIGPDVAFEDYGKSLHRPKRKKKKKGGKKPPKKRATRKKKAATKAKKAAPPAAPSLSRARRARPQQVELFTDQLELFG